MARNIAGEHAESRDHIARLKREMAELRFQYQIATPRERTAIARKIGTQGKRILNAQAKFAEQLKRDAAQLAEQRRIEAAALKRFAASVSRAREKAKRGR